MHAGAFSSDIWKRWGFVWYNMRRRSQNLPVVTISEFERKIELLRLARQYAEGERPPGAFQRLAPEDEGSQGAPALSGAAAEFHAAVRFNRKGRDHLKRSFKRQSEDDNAETAAVTDERTAAAKAAAAAWRAALQQYPERCNLFEQMPAFASATENLQYMKTTYGFFVPDEEYCVNVAGLLRCLWREQQREPRCLFCCRRFSGIRGALQHMQQQRHFQLKWNGEQQDLLHRFYDYKKSYYELLERLAGPKVPQLKADENVADIGSGQTVPAGAAENGGIAEVAVDEEGDWEDCSSDDGDGTTAASEQQKLEEMLTARGWRHAHVTDEGHLQLPSGQE
ncbi:Ribosome biogenesis protein, related [Eimeria brunetti]|uniref:Ribosome biogenesis protein, related n=1 Tax=Eimeria brunetti TaxID=51314 RepID=U6LHX5_9EIME|nr:Ribosome biogenesis protein, related [Eimeria brunetti]